MRMLTLNCYIIILKILVISINIVNIYSYRLEPINIYKKREKFYYENILKYSNNLNVNFSDDKGYFCLAQKEIKEGDDILEVPRNFTYSTFDEYPLKSKLFETIRDNKLITKNVNLTNNILLASRLLFDLKANVTEIFILMKRFGKEGNTNYFEDYKSYLKSRSDFFFHFLRNLPLPNIYSQTSWSDEDIDDYMITGFLPVMKNELVKVYHSLIEDFQKEKLLSDFTKNWFNSENLSYFLSLYGYIISRSFRINLKSYSVDKTPSLINKQIDNLGGSILIPFIDLCNHYHPKLENKEETSAKLKLIKVLFSEENLKIQALSYYKSNEEFSFSYSSLLTNDYLLLNYGFIIRNNPFQQFVFRFDIDDPGYRFFKKLQNYNFDVNQISFIDNNKLAIHFPLNTEKLSRDLVKFIEVYLELHENLEEEKFKKMKIYQKLSKSISKSELKLLKIYMLYFSTIGKNILTVFESIDKKSLSTFVDMMMETEEKKHKLVNIIHNNTKNFNAERNLAPPYEDDDIQNLFYFKTLHSYIKKSLIQHFNFENIKILYSQQDVALLLMMNIYQKNINHLKKEYV